MKSDLLRCAMTSKCMTKWLTKADLKNSCKNTWNMHDRGDIIRSQMFYSVYTKVTRSNHQRANSPSNLARLELVLNPQRQKKKKKDAVKTWRDVPEIYLFGAEEKRPCWSSVAFVNDQKEASVIDPEIDLFFKDHNNCGFPLTSLWLQLHSEECF